MRISFGDFVLDSERRELTRKGENVRLSPKAFAVLELLLKERPRALPKRELLARVWPDVVVEEQNVKNTVVEIRAALGESAGMLRTVPRFGYAFEEVEHADNPASAPKHRIRARVWVAAIALLLLTAVITMVARSTARAGSESKRSLIEVQKVTVSGTVWDATISDDGAFVAYVNEGHSLRLKHLASGSEVELYNSVGATISRLSFTPDRQFIYFQLLPDRGSTTDLWRISFLGGRPEKILGGLSALGVPISFAPDGSQFVFTRGDAGAHESILKVARTDGSNERPIASVSHQTFGDAVWSPHGESIVAIVDPMDPSHDTPKPVLAIDVRTGKQQQILTPPTPFSSVAWAPDGKSLLASTALGEGGQIWRIPLAHGTPEQLTNDLNAFAGITGSRDSNKVVAIRRELSGNLWRFDTSTGTATRITSGAESEDGAYGVAIAADGDILFTRQKHPEKPRVWITSMDGDRDVPLTREADDVWSVDIAHDNEHLAVVEGHREQGKVVHDVWIANMHDAVERRLTFDGDVTHAVFSPDDRWIYYDRGYEEALWKVPVSGGTPQRALDGFCGQFRFAPITDWVACWDKPLQTERAVADDYQLEFVQDMSVRVFRLSTPNKATHLKIGGGPWRWDPTGTAIAFTCGNIHAMNICVQPVAGGPRRQITHFGAEKLEGGRLGAFAWRGDRLVVGRTSEEVDAVLITGLPGSH